MLSIVQNYSILQNTKVRDTNDMLFGGELKDKHKLGITLLLLIAIMILTISTLFKIPLTKNKKVLQNETRIKR